MRDTRTLRGGLFLCLIVSLVATGCARGPTFIPVAQRRPVDRRLVEYPGGVVMKEVGREFNAPVDVDFDDDGTMFVAAGGYGDFEPTIIGYREDGTTFSVYPAGRLAQLPFRIPYTGAFRIYGPIGGMAVDQQKNKIYVTHRDYDGNGMITAFGFDGSHSVVVAGLPAQGDFGMGDVAISRVTGRLWFGVGAATNSGVVGLDNWHWAKKYGSFCDKPALPLRLTGYHFMSKNPDAGLLGGSEIAVTGPFQAFGESTKSIILAARNDRPTAALYSCDPAGGGLAVEAHGIRWPRGIAFDEFDRPYMTNNGMELRGTRPVKDDPDAVLWVANNAWYGWPDFSADLLPITSAKFQPPPELAIPYGYPDVSFLIDHNASNNGEGLIPPRRNSLLQGVFPSLSGVAKLDFVPSDGPLKQWRNNAIVALSGDRSPFATGGAKNFRGPMGFKVCRLDMTTREIEDVVRNTKGGPASRLPRGEGLIERPWAVKFAPDGKLYIVDIGEMDHRDGRDRVKRNTGRIYVIEPAPGAAEKQPATRPAPAPARAPAPTTSSR
jgi:hypothetical protein